MSEGEDRKEWEDETQDEIRVQDMTETTEICDLLLGKKTEIGLISCVLCMYFVTHSCNMGLGVSKDEHR